MSSLVKKNPIKVDTGSMGTPSITVYCMGDRARAARRFCRNRVEKLVIFSDMDNERVRRLISKGSRADVLLEMSNARQSELSLVPRPSRPTHCQCAHASFSRQNTGNSYFCPFIPL